MVQGYHWSNAVKIITWCSWKETHFRNASPSFAAADHWSLQFRKLVIFFPPTILVDVIKYINSGLNPCLNFSTRQTQWLGEPNNLLNGKMLQTVNQKKNYKWKHKWNHLGEKESCTCRCILSVESQTRQYLTCINSMWLWHCQHEKCLFSDPETGCINCLVHTNT